MTQTYRFITVLGVVAAFLSTTSGCLSQGDTATGQTEQDDVIENDIHDQLQALLARSVQRATTPDNGDLTDYARHFLAMRAELVAQRGQVLPDSIYDEMPGLWTSAAAAGAIAVPATIRVWRRSLGGADSCTSRVDTIAMEDYVKGVLPHEWIPSWHDESLRAGSIAIRTYATSWVRKGGKYKCADLDDTTASQVYKDDRLPNTTQAVDATKGKLLVRSSDVVFAEYSAENSNPTADGVDDPLCAGKALFGHGRGMCQWGSQRWASSGKDHLWIATHYYPGATIWDNGTTTPPPQNPPPDATPQKDAGVSSGTDTAPTTPDPGEPNPLSEESDKTLIGGCALGSSHGASRAQWGLVFVAVLAVWRARRRQTRR